MTDATGTYWIFGLGFFAQSLFGLRIIVQWWMAEKKQQVVSPSLFWNLSLAGSALFLVYGILRHDFVIILGQIISYFIYVRNLQLKQDWQKFPLLVQAILIAIPVGAMGIVGFMPRENIFPDNLVQGNRIFFIVGIMGQLLLNLRFVYQLYHSERHKQSILPDGFWRISLSGSILLVAYSIYRGDPVLLIAQGMAIVPYTRNIIIGQRKRRSAVLKEEF